jgi:hypothetical protein
VAGAVAAAVVGHAAAGKHHRQGKKKATLCLNG